MVWTSVNRVAHSTVVHALTGRGHGAVGVNRPNVLTALLLVLVLLAVLALIALVAAIGRRTQAGEPFTDPE